MVRRFVKEIKSPCSENAYIRSEEKFARDFPSEVWDSQDLNGEIESNRACRR